MLLKSLQLTVRNLRGAARIINAEVCPNVQSQSYGKWASRKPVEIVNQDELFDVNMDNADYPAPKEVKRVKAKAIKSTASELYKDEMEAIEPRTSKFQKAHNYKKKSSKNEDFDEDDKGNVYTKIYENEKLLSPIMMTIRSKKYRKKQNQILIEGARFMKDAMEAGAVLETVIFSRWEDVKDLVIDKKDVKLFKVTYKSIQLWSTLTTPSGVMAIFKRPEPKKISKMSFPITIICDNVRDPGNMGSILRAAAGVGVEKVLLTKGCVDVWDSKVLRSAAGAHFRVPIFGSKEWDEIRSMLSSDAHVYVADNNVDVYEENAEEQAEEHAEEREEILIEQEEEEEQGKSKRVQRRQKEPKFDSRSVLSNIPVVPYYAVDYTKNEMILVVGGETAGISEESYRLIQNRAGIRVNIPLSNNIDSLNAGMAVGIVSFEAKRQFLSVQNKLEQLSQ